MLSVQLFQRALRLSVKARITELTLSSAPPPPTPGYRSLVCTEDDACASVPHQCEAEGARTSPEQAHSSPDGCS